MIFLLSFQTYNSFADIKMIAQNRTEKCCACLAHLNKSLRPLQTCLRTYCTVYKYRQWGIPECTGDPGHLYSAKHWTLCTSFWCHYHREVGLHGVILTAKSDFMVSFPLRSRHSLFFKNENYFNLVRSNKYVQLLDQFNTFNKTSLWNLLLRALYIEFVFFDRQSSVL